MKSKLIWLEGALLAAPFIILALFWQRLPERVPVHWNLHGEIDGWAGKGSGLLLLPLLSLGTAVLFHFLPRWDPRLRDRAGEKSRMSAVLALLRIVMIAFFAAIFFVQFLVALGHPVPMDSVVINSCLVLFAVLGNYLPSLRRNFFVGIRTPWTLKSAETWRATHRLGGRLMFFGSVFFFVLQFFVGETVVAVLFFSAVLVFGIWSFWYSWRHFYYSEKRDGVS